MEGGAYGGYGFGSKNTKGLQWVYSPTLIWAEGFSESTPLPLSELRASVGLLPYPYLSFRGLQWVYSPTLIWAEGFSGSTPLPLSELRASVGLLPYPYLSWGWGLQWVYSPTLIWAEGFSGSTPLPLSELRASVSLLPYPYLSCRSYTPSKKLFFLDLRILSFINLENYDSCPCYK